MSASTYPIDASTPAVVLKFDPNVMHHGGLGVIRSLGRRRVQVYGVHERRWAPAAHSRYLAGRFFWRPSAAEVDRVLAGLLRLADRIGRPSVLFTTDDAGAIFLAEHGHDLRRWFLFPDPPGICPDGSRGSTRGTRPAANSASLARTPSCPARSVRRGNSRRRPGIR